MLTQSNIIFMEETYVKIFDTDSMDEKDKEFVDKLDGLIDIFNSMFMDYIKKGL